jgi:guanosine-3',5'-bis(diphosphate) 3'-pyrophosphohydrolase
MNIEILTVVRALDFAARKHIDQRRKGLVGEFNPDIASLVLEVTDDKALPKTERKHLQVEHAPHKSVRAKMLKIADKTSNLRAMRNSPPADWSESRKQEYFAWAARVVDGCRGVNPWLEARFDEVWQQGTLPA